MTIHELIELALVVTSVFTSVTAMVCTRRARRCYDRADQLRRGLRW